MSSEYHIQFTRYGNGRREHSAGWFVAADDFSDAYRRANDLLRGMRAADPGNAYELADIGAIGLDRTHIAAPRSWAPNILDRPDGIEGSAPVPKLSSTRIVAVRDGRTPKVGSTGKRKRGLAA